MAGTLRLRFVRLPDVLGENLGQELIRVNSGNSGTGTSVMIYYLFVDATMETVSVVILLDVPRYMYASVRAADERQRRVVQSNSTIATKSQTERHRHLVAKKLLCEFSL